jgi:ATP-dependent exoDNAse (exonuclease V) alpha subunit
MDELRQKILEDILGDQEITLTEDQEQALSAFMSFYKDPEERSTYLLTGSAGTGKTFMINIFSRFLRKMGFKVVLLAPTGRAAKVITRRTHRPAYTIHHHIYNVAEGLYGDLSVQQRPKKEKKKVVYIVDEASMVGDQTDGSTRRGLLLDLLEFVFDEDPYRKLILVGDPVQLPPVGHDTSPALDADFLRFQGMLHLFIAHLTEVKRQVVDSEVLENALLIRDAFLNEESNELSLIPGRDVITLENGYEGLETYLGYYEEGNPDRAVFITYSNYRATQISQAIRRNLFYEDSQELLVPSDLLMVVKNNYGWGNEEDKSQNIPFIANGEMGTVREVYQDTYEEKYGLKFIDAEIEFLDPKQEPIRLTCKLVLDLLQVKLPQLPKEALFTVTNERSREYANLPKREAMEMMRKDPYINALQVKYGYAITGHKSQGGQWENVLIGFEPDYGQNPKAYLRWTYTVFTRAEERVFMLDCPFMAE